MFVLREKKRLNETNNPCRYPGIWCFVNDLEFQKQHFVSKAGSNAGEEMTVLQQLDFHSYHIGIYPNTSTQTKNKEEIWSEQHVG